MKTCIYWLSILLFSNAASRQVGPLNPDEIIRKCINNYAQIQDYTAVFDKTETVDTEIVDDRKI